MEVTEEKKKETRKDLVDELYRGYADPRYASRPIRTLRVGLKRLSWTVVVEGTKLLTSRRCRRASGARSCSRCLRRLADAGGALSTEDVGDT